MGKLRFRQDAGSITQGLRKILSDAERSLSFAVEALDRYGKDASLNPRAVHTVKRDLYRAIALVRDLPDIEQDSKEKKSDR